jgi:hypothetical protein
MTKDGQHQKIFLLSATCATETGQTTNLVTTKSYFGCYDEKNRFNKTGGTNYCWKFVMEGVIIMGFPCISIIFSTGRHHRGHGCIPASLPAIIKLLVPI